MKGKVTTVPMDSIAAPRSQQRDAYSVAGYAKLKISIQKHGILVPLVLRQTGDAQYTAVDGATRLQIARELGFAADAPIPCMLLDADDSDDPQAVTKLLGNALKFSARD